MVIVKRIKTGIEGFDGLIEGGFLAGNSILISGKPGSGKTIFSLQYIVKGAIDYNEFGIYFTFEEKKKSLIIQAAQFGWDLEKLEKEKKLKIISIGTEEIDKNTVKEMIEIINSLKAKRVVVDSLTTLNYLLAKESENNQVSLIKFLYSFNDKMKNYETLTSLLISQLDSEISRQTGYICDGIVNFESESLGGVYSKNLSIKKMRSTKNNEELHPIEIVNDVGMKVHNFN